MWFWSHQTVIQNWVPSVLWLLPSAFILQVKAMRLVLLHIVWVCYENTSIHIPSIGTQTYVQGRLANGMRFCVQTRENMMEASQSLYRRDGEGKLT